MFFRYSQSPYREYIKQINTYTNILHTWLMSRELFYRKAFWGKCAHDYEGRKKTRNNGWLVRWQRDKTTVIITWGMPSLGVQVQEWQCCPYCLPAGCWMKQEGNKIIDTIQWKWLFLTKETKKANFIMKASSQYRWGRSDLEKVREKTILWIETKIDANTVWHEALVLEFLPAAAIFWGWNLIF